MTFRIVQITDLHIDPCPGKNSLGVDTHESLKLVLQKISTLSPAPQAIVASGDLTDQGDEISYLRLKLLFHKSEIPIFAQPGNHDDRSTIDKVFDQDAMQFVEQAELDEWLLVMVDSKSDGVSYGHLSQQDLDQLKVKLIAAKNRPVLIALHHTPLKLCVVPSCQLQNAEALMQLLSQFKNVKAIISGHTHLECEQQLAGIKIMATPSTMVQVQHEHQREFNEGDEFWDFHKPDISRHGFRIIDLHEDGEFESEVQWVNAS